MAANYVLLTFCINSTSIWRLENIIHNTELRIKPRPSQRNELSFGTSIAMVAMMTKYFMCQRKVSNLIYYL